MSTATDSVENVTENQVLKIKKAIISVSDKTGLAEFAAALSRHGVEIFSTGGTRRHLEAEGFDVQDVANYTGFPEMMDGRVKTLHPKIFAGILARRDRSDDQQSMQEHHIVPFDLIVVNLYPFQSTIAKPDVTIAEAVEQIDIGGPSLVRAAAKNHHFVTIVTGTQQYDDVIKKLDDDGGTSLELRQRLMADAFRHTADYDQAIAKYFAESYQPQKKDSVDDDSDAKNPLPSRISFELEQLDPLRYGENSHQRAALYSRCGLDMSNSIVNAEQLNGKQLSYNNLLDLDSALSIVVGLTRPACAVIKHNNPCGAAAAEEISLAVTNAFAGDPVSAFGSVIAMNRELDQATATWMAEAELFVEAIVAPSFSSEALEILTTRPKWKKNVRLMAIGELCQPTAELQFRQIRGGMLVQDADFERNETGSWNCVTEVKPDDAMLRELEFGWSMVRHVKSNAITLSRDCALVGVGAGQMSRVDSVNISIAKAGERSQGSVLASDAFFPFPDSIELAARAGIAAIIQPGGSVNDQQVIDACNTNSIPMVLTGRRHFKH